MQNVCPFTCARTHAQNMSKYGDNIQRPRMMKKQNGQNMIIVVLIAHRGKVQKKMHKKDYVKLIISRDNESL